MRSEQHRRVVIFTPEVPPKIGGVGRSAIRLANGLVEEGWDVLLMTYLKSESPTLPPVVQYMDIHPCTTPVLCVGPLALYAKEHGANRLGELSRVFLETAANELMRFNPDILLTLTVLETGFQGACLAQRLGVPHVCSGRGSDVGSGIFHAERLPFARMAIERSSAVTFVNGYLKETAETVFGPQSKFRVIYNGVPEMPSRLSDNGATRRRVRSELGVRDDDFVVGFNATFREKKGVRYLAQAFRELHGQRKNVSLLVIGGPRSDPERRLAAELFNGGPVSWAVRNAGLLDCHDTIADLHSAMDCIVFPSIEDGLPNAMLESMAVGTPVIASTVFDDVLTHDEDALLVPRHEVDPIVNSIKRLSDDRLLRERLGENARLATLNRLSSSNEVRSYIDLFENLIGGRVHGRHRLNPVNP